MTLPPAAIGPFTTPAPSPIASPADIGLGVSRGLGTAVDDTPAPRVNLWGVPFDAVTSAEAVDRVTSLVAAREPSYLITANLHYVMLHDRTPELRRVTDGAALVLADGQPIVWRSRLGKRSRSGRSPDGSSQDRSDSESVLPERVTGSELIFDLARRGAELGWRIYFLGGRPGVAQRCARRLASLYPGLQIAGVESPPFRELGDRERADQEERIRASRADLLFVAFGQPKGELWISHHYRRLNVPVSVQLGASFDFVAGEVRRAPSIWQRCGMEWAYRLASDPKRLGPRYASNAAFLATTLFRELGEWLCGRIGRRRRRLRDRSTGCER